MDTYNTLFFPIITACVICVAFPFLDPSNQRHRRYLIFFGLALFTRYIIWRTQNSIMLTFMPSIEGFWIWLCFINEIFIFIETGSFYLLLCKTTHRSPQADIFERALRAMPKEQLPTIDVFIPTYNEGIDVLERSIVGATHLEWPKDKLSIWILDDGKRDWLRDFCERKGVGYIRRVDNVHAKAGNINHASSITKGEFIVTLDADFIPYRNFIYRTLGFFSDPKVAIVQTPQHFFNKDFVQANLHLHDTTPDEQRLFFDVMMPARDGWGVAFWCGSSSLTRRTALEQCGGVPTSSITEDLLTTLTLLRHGYVTRYLNEKLSHGIAPEELDGLMTQRERWCRGTIQAFYDPMGPLGRGLTFMQRFFFFPTYWFFSPITRIMAHIIPIVFLWTGVPSVYLDHYSVLINYQIPILLFNFAFEMWVMPHHFIPLLNTASNTLNAFHVFPTVINSLFSPFAKNTFGVTPKGKENATVKKRFYHPYSFIITLILIIFTITGIFYCMSADFGRASSDAFFPIAATWAVFNCIILLVMLFLSIEHPRRRQEERFPMEYASYLVSEHNTKINIVFTDMSLSGARLKSQETLPPKTICHVVIDGMILPSEVLYETKNTMRLRFIDLTLEERDHMIRFLYTGNFNNAPLHTPFKNVLKGLWRRTFGSHDHMYS